MTPINNKILQLMASGLTQVQVAREMNKKGYTPCSLSHIEKLILQLKKEYRAKTTIHLFVKLTKKGLL